MRIVMAEGGYTPGGERPPGSEQDLLADRRARRESESAEAALTRRAQAAEATVQTLETHLASLQQRVRDAEEETRRMAEEIAAERTGPDERGAERTGPGERGADGPSDVVLEYELRRVRQRSHVERQLRIEAEDRYGDLERESRAEIERLQRRLASSERETHELGGRLEELQRELADARRLSTGRTEEARAQAGLHQRLLELERSAAEIQRGLESERAARERSEEMLTAMRESHRQVQALVGDLRSGFARLSVALSAKAGPPLAAAPQAPPGEMADALAAAVTRLRERAGDSDAPQPAPPLAPETPPATAPIAQEPPRPASSRADDAPVAPRAASRPNDAPVAPRAEDRPDPQPAHKHTMSLLGRLDAAQPGHRHSMSLIARLRLARKERRAQQ